MNDIERKFLLAVERGDINTLKQLLNSNQFRFDKNCCDPLARNALVIAIDNENLEIVKLLIDAKIKIGDALLYAIDENFVEAVELLLDHEVANLKRGESNSWEQDRENSFFSADMTPLILAAHRNNFEIIKILLDRQVSPIPDPHDPRCDCKICCQARADDCLKHSRSRINAYRALASPCLMALSSPDPLLTAFEMSAKLENLAKMEPEYKQDYLRLRAQCQTFATKLLDHTRTSKELEILLNYSDEYLTGHQHSDELSELFCQGSLYEMSKLRPTMRHMTARMSTESTSLDMSSSTTSAQQISLDQANQSTANSSAQFLSSYQLDLRFNKKNSMLSVDSVTGRHESYQSSMRLARLKLAIQCKQKTFCAHPNIQELLATMWYENLPGFRKKSALAQSAQIICIGLMFPIYSIAYLVAPHSQLGRYIKKPFIKFICHSASYITFLLVLILASQRVEAFYCWPSLLELFSSSSSSSSETNFTLLKHQIRVTAPPPPSNNYDDSEINTLAAIYKQLGTNPGGPSTARGLDSLSKIFEEMPASAKKRGTSPSPIEVVILIWVLSLIWAELKQIRALGMNYYKDDMWNILDSVASGFYIGTIVLRIVSYLQSDEASREVAREHWHAYDPLLLSEGLFAAATIFSALKLVYIFSVNPYLGPLQISLGRMIIDILRFSWIYMLVLFAFACGMNQLLWYYADLERHQCLNITNYNLAQYYGTQRDHSLHSPGNQGAVSLNENNGEAMQRFVNTSTSTMPPILGNDANMTDDKLMEAAFSASLEDDSSKPPITIDDSCKTWRHFSNVFESSQTLFWANFGLVDLENFDLTGIRQYTRFWALLMFGCYCFINVIVVLNLLIAMMNHSYVKISKRSDIEWKFARTRLWMSYFDTGSTVPAPFNIIPSIKSIRNMICAICCLIYGFIQKICSCLWHLIYYLCGRSQPQSSHRGESNCGAPNLNFNHNGGLNLTLAENVSQDCALPKMVSINCIQKMISLKNRERAKRNCNLTANYRNVIRSLVRRYLINEQRLIEKKSELTEAKLNRWAKLNAFH